MRRPRVHLEFERSDETQVLRVEHPRKSCEECHRLDQVQKNLLGLAEGQSGSELPQILWQLIGSSRHSSLSRFAHGRLPRKCPVRESEANT